MKSSRAMLLAAFMFALPIFASEGQSKPVIEQKDDKKVTTSAADKSWLAVKWAVITGAAATVANWPVDNITTPVLKRVPFIKNNATYQTYVPTIGKTVLAAALIYAAVKAYEAYQDSQNVDAGDDEQLFVDEN